MTPNLRWRIFDNTEMYNDNVCVKYVCTMKPNIFILFIGDLKNEHKVLQWLVDQKSKNPHPSNNKRF